MLPAPVVSVVVPTRNRCDAVVAALTGLATQTHPSFEIIVVDDGSIDDTPEALTRFAAEHPQLAVSIIRNDPAIGANPSRNRGIATARGDIVAFIDDDAVPEPAWLERLAAGLGNGASDRIGAVTGLTLSAAPRNAWERTLKGTQRVHVTRNGTATRLVGTNMAVWRTLLEQFPLDEDRAGVADDMAVSGRSDEEGLYVLLRAAGYAPRVVGDAVVHHDHPHSAGSFLRQAFRGGRSAARLVHKYRLRPRLDLLPFLLGSATGVVALGLWLTVRRPLAAATGVDAAWLFIVPLVFLVAGAGAIAYNDLARKRKSPWETLVTFPLLLVYYHVRLAGYVVETLRRWTGSRS
ncbi:MAG: glycosyltransferase [Phycisphaerales bacterium]|nr:glycosyltransferase [Phycisphaerales bacterium]